MVTAASLVSIGRIAGAYGIRGWLKVVSFTDPADNLFSYKPWRLRQAHTGELSPAELLSHRAHGKGWVIQLAGIVDRDAAAEMRGMEIVVERGQLPPTDQNSYYWADLEGIAVETVAGLQLGCVDQLLETGSVDVMVVIAGDTADGGEQAHRRTLVPFVLDEVVVDVDLEARRMRVNWDISENG